MGGLEHNEKRAVKYHLLSKHENTNAAVVVSHMRIFIIALHSSLVSFLPLIQSLAVEWNRHQNPTLVSQLAIAETCLPF